MQLIFGLLIVTLSAAAAPPFFVANEGQWDAPFTFKAQIGSTTYYVTSSGMTIDFREYEKTKTPAAVSAPALAPLHAEAGALTRPESVRGHVLKMNFVNGNASPEIMGEEKLASYSNYFLGRDSCNWRGHVGHYQKVILREVWPGIDVELVAQNEGVEAVYHVAPFADPSQIQIDYEGLDAPLSVDANGNLLLQSSLGVVKEKAPWAYQQEGHVQKAVETRYQILSALSYTLSVSTYDRRKELVIDPLIYSTYFGGNDGRESIDRLLVLSSGDKLLCGETRSSDFPTRPGAYQEVLIGQDNAYVTQLTADGQEIVFSTLYGSSGYVSGNDLEIMSNGDLLLIGDTGDPGTIPLTANALDTVRSEYEGFVALFTGSGSDLLYSSYLGGDNHDRPLDVAVDATNHVIITGETMSENFPTTPNALYSDLTGGMNSFLLVLDVYSPALIFSTFFGVSTCSGYRVALPALNTVWLLGQTFSSELSVTADAWQSEFGGYVDIFLAQIDLDPPTNNYTTYVGGDGYDNATSIMLLGDNRLALSGYTTSATWPITPQAYDTVRDGQSDGFVTILQPPGSLVASTLLGSLDYDYIEAGGRLPDGTFIAAGYTGDESFPITPNAFDSIFGPNIGEAHRDLFVTKFSADLSTLEYSTFFGGNDIEHVHDIWIPDASTVWIAGGTQSNDFPVTPDALRPQMNWYGYDGFLSCIGISPNEVGTSPARVPNSFQLAIYPNPFNPTTTISLSLSHRERVQFQVYDLLGRQVAGQDWGVLEAGEYRKTFDGAGLPSGVYVMRVQAGVQVKSGKMAIVR